MTSSGTSSSSSHVRTDCRVCGSGDLAEVLSLGTQPPANAFIRPEDISLPEPSFPLAISHCGGCGFVQLSEIVSPDLLFRNYVYVSSTSPTFVAHFEELQRHLQPMFDGGDRLAVDIGSNDGILLKPFRAAGWRVLGVDPATEIAARATADGVETLPEYFTLELGKEIRASRGAASLVSATSSFPHIDGLDSVLGGVRELLAPDGVFMVEAYYLGAMLEKNLFDTIYHEHLSYFTARTITRLLDRYGLEVFAIEMTDTHGGSLRVLSQLRGGPRAVKRAELDELFAREDELKLGERATYLAFAERTAQNKLLLNEMLAGLKADGKRIAGYGAPAKGNTLLNYFGIGPEVLDYIVDDSPWKQGLLTPGAHVPVRPAAALAEQRPDYLLLLAWNFAEPIMKKNADFSAAGGKFIVPVPTPKIL